MLLLGCRPKGRLTEQHDVFFTIAEDLYECITAVNNFWPEAKGNIHIDAWREVTLVDGYEIKVVPHRAENNSTYNQSNSLFFINLGGYKEDEFDEYHYKMLTVANSLSNAIQSAKNTAFYKHVGFKEAPSHIDDKYGVDTDDVYKVEDVLPENIKARFKIEILPALTGNPDNLNLGYLPLYKIQKINRIS